jgi:hypothetical protein
MRRLGLALIAVATLALGAAPMIARAQDKAAAAAAPKPPTKEQRDQGMKEAPAALASAHTPCTLTDAAFLGKSGASSVYEVACKEGLGYIVIGAPNAATPAKTYDCLSTLGNATLTCRLPGNADPKQGLAPLIAAAGLTCTLKDARSIGATSSGEAFYEVACQQGPGFILTKAPPGTTPEVSATPCIEAVGASNVTCKLTSKAEIVASIAKLAAQSGKPCEVSDVRYVGSSAATGETFYEVACGSAPGFMIQTGKGDVFKAAIDCANASGIAGGCKMTDSTKAETQEASLYTGLAKAGGFNCDVSKYRFIGMSSDPKAEVVELACTNRPDGAVALFPVDNKVKATFTDCVRAAKFGEAAACQLSSPALVYAKLTAGLAARGRASCKVSGARYVGSAAGDDYIETACADGGPGWVIELTPTDEVKTLLSCGQAKAEGLTCTLPTNVGK